MSLFPHLAPADLSNRADIIANDWAAYRGLNELTDHWSRPAWPDGAAAYYWLIVPAVSEDLPDLAERAQQAVAACGGFDLVPLDLLHLTVHRVGTINDLSAAHLQTIAVDATKRLSEWTPFDLTVGPLTGSIGAVRFTVSPWTSLTGLYNTLASLDNSQVPKGIRPHLSIAYNNTCRPAAPVIQAVHAARSLPTATVFIDRVHLVTLRRLGRRYTWATQHVVPLGSGGI